MQTALIQHRQTTSNAKPSQVHIPADRKRKKPGGPPEPPDSIPTRRIKAKKGRSSESTRTRPKPQAHCTRQASTSPLYSHVHSSQVTTVAGPLKASTVSTHGRGFFMLSSDVQDAIVKLAIGGWTIQQIANLLSIAKPLIHESLKRHKIKRPAKRTTTKQHPIKRDKRGRFQPGSKPGPGRPARIPEPPDPEPFLPDGSLNPLAFPELRLDLSSKDIEP